ncbi:MAG: thiamine-binding protein [Bacteroidetes bacterium]|nr:thiamine-binding protein [Bacteroidota bacterium]
MIINASVQVVPITKVEEAFPIIDQAIALIQQSGLKYTVGAFATELEGEYDAVQALLKQICDFCYGQKEMQFLVYTKLHLSGGQDILAADKTGKFS